MNYYDASVPPAGGLLYVLIAIEHCGSVLTEKQNIKGTITKKNITRRKAFNIKGRSLKGFPVSSHRCNRWEKIMIWDKDPSGAMSFSEGLLSIAPPLMAGLEAGISFGFSQNIAWAKAVKVFALNSPPSMTGQYRVRC